MIGKESRRQRPRLSGWSKYASVLTRQVHRDVDLGPALKSTRMQPITRRGTAMSPIASIALSGLNAASSRLETAAHNIANAQTVGFRRQLVQQTAQMEGGVTVSIGRAAATGDALIEDVVAQMSAVHAFEANVMTLKAQDGLLGSLLDATA
jgi:hypothetical protein